MTRDQIEFSSDEQVVDFKFLEKYANWLDSKFKIPGTKSTIGIDPLIGMIPVAGDIAGYGFSILLIFYMIKHGASKMLVLKMLGNATLDALIGAIPVLGTIFDFVYKANERNYILLKEYHGENKHQGSTLPFFIGLLICAAVVAGLVVFISIKMMQYFVSLLQ